MNEVRINGLDAISYIQRVHELKQRYIAMTLTDIEETMTSEDEWYFVRKAVLDKFNDYTRAILRDTLGGDVEGLIDY